MTTAERKKWTHQPGCTYQAVRCRIVGNPEVGYREERHLTGERRATREQAERDGWQLGDSDDFAIHVYRAAALVASLWMDEIVDDRPAVLAALAAHTY